MVRAFVICALFVFSLTSVFAADNVVGLWKIIDDKTNKPNAIVSLYMYEGKLYGRILITLSTKTGQVEDTFAQKNTTLPKIAGNPPVCGLDFVYLMVDKGKEWVGSIIDPEPADEYECVITRDGANLKVRGQLKGFGILGRDQKWVPVEQSDIPTGLSLPDASSFVPIIPKRK